MENRSNFRLIRTTCSYAEKLDEKGTITSKIKLSMNEGDSNILLFS